VDKSSNSKPCWKNLDFPQFNARLHLSYFEIGPNSTFEQLTEDARTFAFKHTAMASAIEQQVISLPEHNVYGLEYHIQGNTASNYQFFISDKSKHYLRGALYFNEKPHLDSIQPVLKFIEEDIAHLINTSKWF
jgi:gliding motility-associated lipoprotein GldD